MNERGRSACQLRGRGFTLMEVLVAIALTVALMGAMFGFLFDLLSSRTRVIDSIRQEDAASALISWLEADLMACIGGDSHVGAGIKGDGAQLRVLTRSVLTTLAAQGTQQRDLLGDLQFAEYRFDERGKRIEGRRGPAGSAQSDSASSFSTIPGVIHKLRFRYFNGREWSESFDSLQSTSLPVAVEVSIWMNPWPGEEQAADLEIAATRPDSLADDREKFSGNFDEREFAFRSDMELFDEPKPDRVRVILIPDAKASSEPVDAAGAGETTS